jgi:tRNA pseudouridine55 synthase
VSQSAPGNEGKVGTRSGILLVDKPLGITSHDVVARVRKAAGTRKVGHAGTLDPMASGLLLLGLNRSTRLLTYLVGLDKEYFATIRLGQSTTTDDAEGEVLSEAPVEHLQRADIDTALEPLRGNISQVPSSVSAIKVDGQRAYTLARAGETVELKSRAVTISALEVLEERRGEYVDLDVRVECSSGTYIRALARDLGAALGVGGHITALRRSRIGPYSVEAAAALEGIDVGASLLSAAAAASQLFPVLDLDEQQAIDLSQGKRLQTAEPDAGPVAAVSGSGRLVALVTISGGVVKTLATFPPDEEAPPKTG